jgi:hypothetical protein
MNGKGNRMSNNPRDTQFAGFAKALLAEVLAADGVVIEPDNPNWPEEQLIIARRAYDLVAHAIECLDCKGCESVEWVSDLPVLPEEKG